MGRARGDGAGAAGAPADGSAVGDLPCGEGAWVSLVLRDGTLLTAADDTTMQAGDDVLSWPAPTELRPWSAPSPTRVRQSAPRSPSAAPGPDFDLIVCG